MGQMQYRVVARDIGDGKSLVDTVYVNDFNGKCWKLVDSDGDSIPDACGYETTNNCFEKGKYELVKCNGRRKGWFSKVAVKDFDSYMAAADLPKRWQLEKVSHSLGLTTTRYSCGDYCSIELFDTNSDGRVDDAFLVINMYSVAFLGKLPDTAHEMLQRATLTAFDHFLPGSFTKTLGEGKWEVGIIEFSGGLAFEFNPFSVTASSLSFNGDRLEFAKDPEAVEATVSEASIPVASDQCAPGTSHMLISESGGEMTDVSDQYSGGDDLGVVPLPTSSKGN